MVQVEGRCRERVGDATVPEKWGQIRALTPFRGTGRPEGSEVARRAGTRTSRLFSPLGASGGAMEPSAFPAPAGAPPRPHSQLAGCGRPTKAPPSVFFPGSGTRDPARPG